MFRFQHGRHFLEVGGVSWLFQVGQVEDRDNALSDVGQVKVIQAVHYPLHNTLYAVSIAIQIKHQEKWTWIQNHANFNIVHAIFVIKFNSSSLTWVQCFSWPLFKKTCLNVWNTICRHISFINDKTKVVLNKGVLEMHDFDCKMKKKQTIWELTQSVIVFIIYSPCL